MRLLSLMAFAVIMAAGQSGGDSTVCGGSGPFVKWRDEDAVYLLTPDERSAFNQLRSANECRAFIERFWLARDPNRATVENEAKEEHYRRIAYANERFPGTGHSGWRTDRGRIYIVYGPPSRIESYPQGVSYGRPREEGGGTTSTFPLEKWIYNSIPGIGENVIVEFVDRSGTGDHKMVELIDARSAAALNARP